MDKEKAEHYLILGSWVLLIASIVGWPLSAFTFAKKEPQAILALSWIAILISAGTLLLEAYVKRDQDD